jgi:hypothetical protein
MPSVHPAICFMSRTTEQISHDFTYSLSCVDRLCGLVVRGPGYRSRGPGSITGAARFSEK